MGPKVGTTASFKKGRIVTVKRGEYLWRPITREELDAWYASDDSKGMDDAGESKLPPKTASLRSDGATPYKVVEARVSAKRGYGNPIPGCCSVVDANGVAWYIERRHCL